VASEADLYGPIKSFLIGQGYEVKGEVERCDLVAVRGDESPVVVELKTSFNLDLVLQGVDRLKVSDKVYLAVPEARRGSREALWVRRYRDVVRLCRMLGLGLLVVHLGDPPRVEPHLDPAPYRPRRSRPRRERLLQEFTHRVGDPNPGGTRGRPIVTAYRQDALRCAHLLDQRGPLKASALKELSAVGRAPAILLRDVYGWFERIERGVYDVTPKGRAALETYANVVARL
jgi:hypothetical protein